MYIEIHENVNNNNIKYVFADLSFFIQQYVGDSIVFVNVVKSLVI